MAPQQGNKVDARVQLQMGEANPSSLSQRTLALLRKKQNNLTNTQVQNRIKYLANPDNQRKVAGGAFAGGPATLAGLQRVAMNRSIGQMTDKNRALFNQARQTRLSGGTVDAELQKKLAAIKQARANRYLAKGNDYYQTGFKKYSA